MTTTRTEFSRKPVENLLSARSVAIVGASTKGRWPLGIYRNLKAAKFPGNIYLINPNYTEIFDDKCYPNLAALPEVPEHLLMLIPTRAVLGTIEEAAKLGTKAATIYSAGFGEGDDPRGTERARAMKELCDRTGFVVCGPNCMGSFSLPEGLRPPQEFTAVAEQALKKNKPILVVKLGRSEMGKRQAISHTGALAGADEVFDAVCNRLGLIRVPTLEDLTEMTLAFMPGRFPRGSRAAIVVNSGGMKGLLCDHCDELHTNLAQLSDQTKEAVRPLIPPELVVENPLECGVAGFGDEQGFINIVKLHAEDDGVDLLAIHGEPPRGEKRDPALFRNLAAATDKPILAFARSTYSCTDESRTFQEEAGIPFLQAIKPMLRALAGL